VSGRNNRIRIIGGRWRGRRLSFPDSIGLRPTPDRVRETLFNWLNPIIDGARCLDLFAGSGALGIEALSRGAAEVVFVEQNPQAVQALYRNLNHLQVQAMSVYVARTDALRWLTKSERRTGQVFDIVLMDPPFRHRLIEPVCRALDQYGWLAPHASVYLEMEHDLKVELPQSWRLQRKKSAGQLDYCLITRQS
jgi:16S rRNA (guanine966-N2)-methyltransferase